MPEIGIIVLAAGASSRMGEPKQLLKVKGQSLIRYMLNKLINFEGSSVVCVLGKYADLIEQEIADLSVHRVINNDWEEGMGTSIQVGMKRLIRVKPELSAAIILLVDQPFVDQKILSQLKEAYYKTGKKIVASKYGNTYGVPVLFDQTVFQELTSLKGNIGAKKIIRKYLQNNEAAFIDFPKGAVDLDTPEDYERLLRAL